MKVRNYIILDIIVIFLQSVFIVSQDPSLNINCVAAKIITKLLSKLFKIGRN